MKNHKRVRKEVVFSLNTIFFLLLLFFLCANILFSQTISPLYASVVNEDKKSTALFLRNVMDLPDFDYFLRMNESIYGSSIRDDVFREDRVREKAIQELERILTINPKSRDALVALSRLYEQKGDDAKAAEYLRRAKEIDPQAQGL